MNIRMTLWLSLIVSLPFSVPAMAQEKSEPKDHEQKQTGTLQFGERTKIGTITSDLIGESSGVASSIIHDGCFWTHNDNGGVSDLFLVDETGKLQATLALMGAAYRDWEDIACVKIQNESYILLADVGDNLSRHASCRVYLVKEPKFEIARAARKHRKFKTDRFHTIEFKYPNGACDCEAMAVDVSGEKIFFVSKRPVMSAKAPPPSLHWIPLQLRSTTKPIIANKVDIGFQRSMVTGMDISSDGKLAVFRSYTSAWLYQSKSDQTWLETLADTPDSWTLLPLQRQGEAIGFTQDNKSVLLTSEGVGRPIWKIELEEK